jgi:hypothetical protein
MIKEITLKFETIHDLEDHMDTYREGIRLREFDELLRKHLKYGEAQDLTASILSLEGPGLPSLDIEMARRLVYATTSHIRSLLTQCN